MLNKQDIKQIKAIIEQNNKVTEAILDLKLEEKTKEISEKISRLPTKMDRTTGELETVRNEQKLIAHSQEDYDGRLEKLEQIHPRGRHAFVTD